MADQIPLKVHRTNGNTDALAEFRSGDTIPVEHGGTGATDAAQARANIGAASQVALVNHLNDSNNPHGLDAQKVGAVPLASRGQPNGVCELDGGGKVPLARIPATAIPSVHVVADAAARLALDVQEGDEAKQIDDGSHWIYDGSQWRQYPRNLFGTEFHHAADPDVHTTTSTTFQTELELNVTSLPLGTYRLGWSYGWNHDTTWADFEAWLLIDWDDALTQPSHRQEPKDNAGNYNSTGSDQRHYVTRFLYLENFQGDHIFAIEYRSRASGKKASIWQQQIELWRVA